VREQEAVARIKYGTLWRGDRVDPPKRANFFHGILRAGDDEPDFPLVAVRRFEEGLVENTNASRRRMVVIRDVQCFDRQTHPRMI